MSAKPPKPQRKIEEFRVTRKSGSHAPAHGGEGWAVSYADMLMVLLSFFVMFFSLKEESPESFDDQLKKIALSMKGDAKGQAADARKPDATASPTTAAGAGTTGNLSNVGQALAIKGVTVVTERNQLVLTLDDAAFASAGYKVTPDVREKMDEIIKRLQPFQNQIQITIVGHTDSRKLKPRNEFLSDNFDLSSMRALKVLKYVLSRNFPENRASARAASSFDRDARSVSIVIQQLEEPKTETGA